MISEGVQVTPRPPTENNHQGKQRLLLVINVAVESEKKTRTIKAAVQPATGSCHTKTFMGMLAENPSTQMSGLGSSFQSEENNSMVAEAMEEYELASAEAAYEDPGEQAQMGFMAAGGRFNDGNASHWWDQKHTSFPIHNSSENTNWETSVVHMSVTEEATRKAKNRFNAPLEFCGCTNSPIYHTDRFQTYRN